jgi:uncharacterized membrane protein
MRKFAVLALTVTLFAAPYRAAADEYPQPVHVVAAVLELSDAQIASWIQLLGAREAALQPLRQQMQNHQESIGHLLQAPAPDPQTLGQLMIETRTIQQQIGAVVAQTTMQFEQLLTSDQRQRLQQIRGAAQVCPAGPAFEATGLL